MKLLFIISLDTQIHIIHNKYEIRFFSASFSNFSQFVSFLGHQNPALVFLNFLEISAFVSYKLVSYKKIYVFIICNMSIWINFFEVMIYST